jgi:hypothetical protein
VHALPGQLFAMAGGLKWHLRKVCAQAGAEKPAAGRLRQGPAGECQTIENKGGSRGHRKPKGLIRVNITAREGSGF